MKPAIALGKVIYDAPEGQQEVTSITIVKKLYLESVYWGVLCAGTFVGEDRHCVLLVPVFLRLSEIVITFLFSLWEWLVEF